MTECIGKVAYRLALPAQMAMHPVFHVSLLQPYRKGEQVGRCNSLPPFSGEPFSARGELAYNIEKIVAQKQTL